MDGYRPWREAMADALTGPGGFYRTAGAAVGAFATAADSALFLDALSGLAVRVDETLDRPREFTVVDVGASDGRLLRGLRLRLAERLGRRLRLVGVDVCHRPDRLPADVGWAPEPPAALVGLVIAHEWLDVLPVAVVEATGAGLRLVEVDGAGRERLGAPAERADADWLRRWWPVRRPGHRAEVGTGRDTGWASLVSALRAGLALAVDYPLPAHPVRGTLSGYRAGRQVPPVPDGRTDLTAHVHFGAVAAAGRAAGAGSTAMISQRVALAAAPATGTATDVLGRLAHESDRRWLRDPAGLGRHRWLAQTVAVDPPAPFDGSVVPAWPGAPG